MVRVAESVNVTGRTPGKAKEVWLAIYRECTAKKLPKVQTRYGTGYMYVGSFQSFAGKLWNLDYRRNAAHKLQVNQIRDFLRDSGNVVIVDRSTRGGRPENKIFIRAEWRDALAIPVPITGGRPPDAIDRRAARLTPEEAGETRPPAPVQVSFQPPTPATPVTFSLPGATPDSPFVGEAPTTEPPAAPKPGPTPAKKAAATKEPAAKTATKKKAQFRNTPDTIVMDDGRLKCGECKEVFETPAAVAGHKRKHFNERAAEQVGRLQLENARLREQLTANRQGATPAGGSLVDSLQAAIEIVQATEGNQRLIEGLNARVADLETQLTEAGAERARLLTAMDEAAEAEALVPTPDEETLRRAQHAEAVVELVRGVLKRFQDGETGPVRTIADLEDLFSDN